MPGERTCKCKEDYLGNGFNCTGKYSIEQTIFLVFVQVSVQPEKSNIYKIIRTVSGLGKIPTSHIRDFIL